MLFSAEYQTRCLTLVLEWPPTL